VAVVSKMEITEFSSNGSGIAEGGALNHQS